MLDRLISQIENLRSPTTSVYCQYLTEIHIIVEQITSEWIKLTPDRIVTEYVSRINNPVYAQAYGTGHLVIDNPYDILHWNILPAYYSVCCPTPCEELAMLVDIRKPKISQEITTVPRDWSKVELWTTDAYKKFIE